MEKQLETTKGLGDVSAIYQLINRNESRIDEKLDLDAFEDMLNVKSLNIKNPDHHGELFRMVSDSQYENNHVNPKDMVFGFNEMRKLIKDVHGE